MQDQADQDLQIKQTEGASGGVRGEAYKCAAGPTSCHLAAMEHHPQTCSCSEPDCQPKEILHRRLKRQQAIVDKLQPSMDKLFKEAGIDEKEVNDRIDRLLAQKEEAKRHKDIQLYKDLHFQLCDTPLDIYWERIPEHHNMFGDRSCEVWYYKWYAPGGHYWKYQNE